MQNWRHSYDFQKTKLSSPYLKINGFPKFLLKTNDQKTQYKKLNDNLGSQKKTKSFRISPVKSLQISPKKKYDAMEAKSPPISPKYRPIRKNIFQPNYSPKLVEHKSSIITNDSQSNNHVYKDEKRKRFMTQCFQQKEVSIQNVKKYKKDCMKIQRLSPLQNKNPGVNQSRTNAIQKQKSSQKLLQLPTKVFKGIQEFSFLKQIGKGYNSIVFLTHHKITGMFFAIKILIKQYIKSQSVKQNIFRQIKIHSFIKNPNILNLYTILSDQKFFYLIMQYAVNGTLYSLLKQQNTFPQQKAAKIIQDICIGVRYLHDHNIIHRDLKLQNIMMTAGVAKIGDFGCAVNGYCMRKSKIGSPAYLSPEQLNQNFYGKKIDIWSIGIMTYEMLFGTTPFDKQISQFLSKGQTYVDMKVRFPSQPIISAQATNFITKCLQRKQHNRMDINQVMKHPFLNKTNKIKQKEIKY